MIYIYPYLLKILDNSALDTCGISNDYISVVFRWIVIFCKVQRVVYRHGNKEQQNGNCYKCKQTEKRVPIVPVFGNWKPDRVSVSRNNGGGLSHSLLPGTIIETQTHGRSAPVSWRSWDYLLKFANRLICMQTTWFLVGVHTGLVGLLLH